MTLAFIILGGGLVVISIVLLVRSLDGGAWASELMALELHWPAGLSADDVVRWLGILAASLQPPRGALLRHPPIAIEIVASKAGIKHYLLATKQQRASLLSSLRAGLPGVRIEDSPDYVSQRPGFCAAAELRTTTSLRPLAVERTEDAASAVLAGLQPLHSKEQVVIQWILAGTATPQPARAKGADGLPWWLELDAPADADELRAARVKQRQPLLSAIGRIGVAASADRANALLGRTIGGLRVMSAPGVRLVRRWLPASVVADRVVRRALPLTAYPMTLNASEAAGLLAVPYAGVSLPGVSPGCARQLAPPPSMPRTGLVVARSNYVGMGRPLTLAMRDRLMHTCILGPTGVGKSTLIANMALQDIEAGHGVVVIDPKGDDLVPNILARIPEARHEDVILLDPAASDRPVGWNLLHIGHGEHGLELAVDFVVHVLSELWANSWGPRTADVMRASLLTLTHATAPNGSAFTLVDIPALLTDEAFRRYVLRQDGIPGPVRGFWTEFEARGETGQAVVIGPSMNKIRSFSSRTALRLILGQSEGIDLNEVFTRRRILLVPLGKGTVGQDTAQLLGALLVSSLWQTALGRVTVPEDKRAPVVCYIDEAQDVVRLPLALEDMLAQARSLKLALVLANQSLGQLPESMQSALLEVARTTITFQSGNKNAKALAPYFAPLTADDLKSLAAHEIAMRPCIGGQTHSPVTGTTLPLPDPTTDAQQLAECSRERYGQPRADVESDMEARATPPKRTDTFGRKHKGGHAS